MILVVFCVLVIALYFIWIVPDIDVDDIPDKYKKEGFLSTFFDGDDDEELLEDEVLLYFDEEEEGLLE